MGCSTEKEKSPKEGQVRISKLPEEKEKDKLYEIKLVLLGEQAVGKSSLVERFCSGKFEDKYKITIGGAYLQKEIILKNGDKLKLHIWDTGGQEKFRAMAPLYYKDAAGAILVYDVSNNDSLGSLSYWIQELNENVDKNDFTMSIAGNKSDLPPETKRISFAQGKNFSKDNDVPIFYETSAKTGAGVKDLFYSLAQKVYENQKKKLESK